MLKILDVEVYGNLEKALVENFDIKEVEEATKETMDNLRNEDFLIGMTFRESVIFVLGSVIHSLSN